MSSKPPADPVKPVRILHREDDRNDRVLNREILQAASGVEVLEACKWLADKIARLLTGLVLPDDRTGPVLAEKLRAARPELKRRFCSGCNPETASRQLSAFPGFTFLRNPDQPKTLACAVREMLDRGSVTPATPSRSPFA